MQKQIWGIGTVTYLHWDFYQLPPYRRLQQSAAVVVNDTVIFINENGPNKPSFFQAGSNGTEFLTVFRQLWQPA
ncbi:MAG TPA: hypothetical protein VGO57_09585 [Verrucomicrobiae bacterium]